MMTLDHVGDREAMVYAQLGQQPLVRTTATSLEPRQGSLSCLRAQPPDLADLTVARPKVACVPLAGLPFLYSKRTAVTRSLVSRYGRSNVLSFVAISSTLAVELHTNRHGVGFTLLSRSYYYLRRRKVPAPRSRPTTVRQGNRGL